MALFSRKQTPSSAPLQTAANKEEKKTVEASKGVSAPETHSLGSDLSAVLRNPRITEKATMHQESGVYTFDVADDATKRLIIRAVSFLYQVTPRKVRIVTIPSKQKRNARTGKKGVTRGGKKAYVYLKAGENITIA